MVFAPDRADVRVRALLVVAALLLVGAFALATLAAWDTSLAELLQAADPGLPGRIEAFIRLDVGTGAWTWLFRPVLLRPCWMLPLFGGLICLGLVASLSWPTGNRHKRRI